MPRVDFTKIERVVVHTHAVTARYREYILQSGHHNPDGWPEIPQWTPEQHISMMKECNTTTAILSISTPGTYLQPFDALLTKDITRTTNEELSEVSAKHPEYFRFFASLPLPSIPDSLAEMDYALDVLGAVGFCILSSANGFYLGGKALDPIFDKLNQRKAIVFMHQITCKVTLGGDRSESGASAPNMSVINPLTIPSGLLEYMFDETRAVANLIVSGTVSRCSGTHFIMSHGGCLLPPYSSVSQSLSKTSLEVDLARTK